MAFWSQQRSCSISPSLPLPNGERGSFVEIFFIPGNAREDSLCVPSLAAFVTHKCHFSECPSAVSGSPVVGSHHSRLSLLPCLHYPGIIIPTPAVPAHPAVPQGHSLNSTWSRNPIYPSPKMSPCCSCCVHFEFAAGVDSEPQGLVLTAGNGTLGLSVHIHHMDEATLSERL